MFDWELLAIQTQRVRSGSERAVGATEGTGGGEEDGKDGGGLSEGGLESQGVGGEGSAGVAAGDDTPNAIMQIQALDDDRGAMMQMAIEREDDVGGAPYYGGGASGATDRSRNGRDDGRQVQVPAAGLRSAQAQPQLRSNRADNAVDETNKQMQFRPVRATSRTAVVPSSGKKRVDTVEESKAAGVIAPPTHGYHTRATSSPSYAVSRW